MIAPTGLMLAGEVKIEPGTFKRCEGTIARAQEGAPQNVLVKVSFLLDFLAVQDQNPPDFASLKEQFPPRGQEPRTP